MFAAPLTVLGVLLGGVKGVTTRVLNSGRECPLEDLENG